MESQISLKASATNSKCKEFRLKDVFLNSIVFVTLLLSHIFIKKFMKPYRRGFFCNDDTLMYPFHEEIISTSLLVYVIVPLPPLITFLCGEYIVQRQRQQLLKKKFTVRQMLKSLAMNFVKQKIYFSIGILITLDAMDIAKYTLGRLRPHFMAVCQPQMMDGSTCRDPNNQHRYVEDYICVANGFTESDVYYARLSFPSGHSGLTFFTTLYVAIYLHNRFSWQHGRWMKHLLQFLLMLLAWYVALTRISDHWHHTIDVLFGSALGILSALFTAAYIGQLWKSEEKSASHMMLSRRDTSATLNELYIAEQLDKTTVP